MNSKLSLYDALLSANVPSDKARAVVEALEHEMYTVLATKADLAGQQLLFKEQLARVHAEMRAELANGLGSVRAELAAGLGSVRGEMAELRAELRGEMAGLRDELHGDMAGLRQQMTQLRSSLVLQLGSGLAVGLGLLFAALKLT